MKTYQRCFLAVFAAAGVALAQAPAPVLAPARVAFEVASIRPTGDIQGQVTGGLRIDGVQVQVSLLTMRDLVAIAYRTKPYLVQCPDWMTTDRFTISATIPAGVSTTQLPELFKSLLEDRFELKQHIEKRDTLAYVLEVGKGGFKLQPVPVDPEEKISVDKPLNITGSGSSNGISVDMGRGSSYSFANNRFEAKKVTMEAAAQILERFVDRPIVDMTKLPGAYDFVLDISAEDYRIMLIRAGVNAGVVLPPQVLKLTDGATFGTLMDGIEKFGLKLDRRKVPYDYVVVDASRKLPTEN